MPWRRMLVKNMFTIILIWRRRYSASATGSGCNGDSCYSELRTEVMCVMWFNWFVSSWFLERQYFNHKWNMVLWRGATQRHAMRPIDAQLTRANVSARQSHEREELRKTPRSATNKDPSDTLNPDDSASRDWSALRLIDLTSVSVCYSYRL